MKIIILLMSCNQPLYENEEQACRDTFLKDAEEAGVAYYFYKGLNDAHPDQCIDEETHTIYLNVNDGLGGTGRKTTAALKAISGMDYDYVVKTNVSTYLNIQNLCIAINGWEGSDDENIYGGRFIVNKASKNIPFPRGYFTVLSKKLVNGILPYIEKLALSPNMPRTDDTLLSFGLLYYINKTLGKSYSEKLMEVPSVVSWDDKIWENPCLGNAMAIRCKNEKDNTKTPENMLNAHMAVKQKMRPKDWFLPATQFETGYGLMSYGNYVKFDALFEQIKNASGKTDG